MAFELSNDIESGTEIVAAEHQQNYTEIEAFLNSGVVLSDGSNGMDSGKQLLLGASATAALGAVTKSQMDAADDSHQAAAIASANSYTDTQIATRAASSHTHNYAASSHTHAQYADSGHGHPYTLVKPVTVDRIYSRGSTSAGTSFTVTLPSTVGGQSRIGATGVVAYVSALTPTTDGHVKARETGGSWGDGVVLNYRVAGGTTGALVMIGLNGSYQFDLWNEVGANAGMNVDVQALLFEGS